MMVKLFAIFLALFASAVSAEQYTSLRGLPIEIDLEKMEVRSDHTVTPIEACRGFNVCLTFYDYIIAVPNAFTTAEGYISEQYEQMRVDSLPFIEEVSIFGRTVEGRLVLIYDVESFTLLSKLIYSPYYGVISFSVEDSTYWMSETCGIYASEECKELEDISQAANRLD